LGAKARAILRGRYYASTEDIRAVAHPVLRHRIITTFGAEAEGITADMIVDKLLEHIPAKESEVIRGARVPKVLGSKGD
jgi:MoxR-like ATPase